MRWSWSPPTTQATSRSLWSAQRVLARAYGFAAGRSAGACRRAGDLGPRHGLVPGRATNRSTPSSGWPASATPSRTSPIAPSSCSGPSLPRHGDRGDDGRLRRVGCVADLLDHDPAAVARTSVPHDWPPLLYLATPARRRRSGRHAAGPARRGGRPGRGFLWQRLPSPFTAVTGVLGGGSATSQPTPRRSRW